MFLFFCSIFIFSKKLKKSFFEQLDRAFSDESNTIPEQISFIQSNDFPFLTTLKDKLIEMNHRVIETSTFIEMKTTFSYLINKIQKFCNCNSRAPSTIKICIFGSDAYLNTVLRAYVEYLSNKSPEWQNYMRFYPIPLCNSGSTALSLFLGTIDSQYQSNFCNGKWRELFDTQNQTNLIQELIGRVKMYLNNSTLTIQIPIAESMIMYKTAQAFIPFICSVKIGFQDKNLKSGNVSIDEDKELQLVNTSICNISSSTTQPTSSPPNYSSTSTATNKTDLQNVVNNLNNLNFQTNQTNSIICSNGANHTNTNTNEITSTILSKETIQLIQQQRNSPPNSPGTTAINQQLIVGVPFSPTSIQPSSSNQTNTSFSLLNNGSNLISPDSKFKETLRDREECLDLQIDYWTTSAKQQSNVAVAAMQMDNVKKPDLINNKITLKSTFKTLQISRLLSSGTNDNQLNSPSLTLSYLTKEKKQKSRFFSLTFFYWILFSSIVDLMCDDILV